MKKVPLYTLTPDDVFLMNKIEMRVTSTKTFSKDQQGNQFQHIYCKQVNGVQSVHAPAGLMVEKID